MSRFKSPTKLPPLRLEWRTPAELADNPENWRKHPDSQTDGLTAVIGKVGWAGAALYNETTGRLIDGHARKNLPAACLVDGKIPVLVGNWTEEQEKLILLTLDPLAALAEADNDILGKLLLENQSEDAAIQALLEGLANENEIALTPEQPAADPEPQIDRAAELQKQWGTEQGQLWTIPGKAGVHRVLCGDSRDAAHVARLMAGASINVAFTSPPYASQRKYDESSGFKPIPPDEYVAWWEPLQDNVRRHLAADGSVFVNIKPHCEDGERVLYVFDLVLRMRRGWGWRFVDEFCWKNSGTPCAPQGRFKNQFEPVYQFAREPHKFRPDAVMHESARAFTNDGETNLGQEQGKPGGAVPQAEVYLGLAYPGNVVSVNVDNHGGKGTSHSAAFPVGLPSFFIAAFSDQGDLILDPFLGSGTTLIAAENLSRVCYGMEISPAYVAVILQRAADAGLSPVLEA